MRPSVFVDIEFFDVLENYLDTSAPYEPNHRAENRNQLIDIFKESDISVHIADKEIIKLSKKASSATYSPSSWQEVILLRALRNSRLQILPNDSSTPNRIHLLNLDRSNAMNFASNNNVLCEGTDYDFENPVSPISIASVEVDKNMNGIDKVKHRCRNVILIDPYIFAPLGSAIHNVPKLPNLIKLLKEFFIDNSAVSCHLSILYHRDSVSHSLVQGKIDSLKTGLGNLNLEISAFGHEDNLFQSNRHIVTDYSVMDLQHPFDRDDSSISANFLFDRNIRESFMRAKKLIDIAKASYNRTPQSFGLQQVKFGDIMQNKLFY